MANVGLNGAFWRGKRVFLTGHTGFKGGWLSLWLEHLGAEVTGYSNGVPTSPSFYESATVEASLQSVKGDVRDLRQLTKAVRDAQPEIVVHMAAQSLVRRSYAAPVETFETNVLGTVNLLEAVRLVDGVQVALIVTSDKCYENRGGGRSHRESDPLGGSDPYSASKACAELVTAAYDVSFLSAGPGVASARAGNVIGGGDWASDRLVPDLMRAALGQSMLIVRNPRHVRPWQHVLNPLAGYLMLVEQLWGDVAAAGAWNFGPPDTEARPVEWLVSSLATLWAAPIDIRFAGQSSGGQREAEALKLDSSRARRALGWRPAWTLERGVAATAAWYAAFSAGDDVRRLAIDQIVEYEADLAASS